MIYMQNSKIYYFMYLRDFQYSWERIWKRGRRNVQEGWNPVGAMLGINLY